MKLFLRSSLWLLVGLLLVASIIFSFPSAGVQAQLGGTPTPIPDELQLVDYGASSDIAVAELRDLGIVPPGGEEVYNIDDEIFLFGTEGLFIDITIQNPHTNFVMGGDLLFTPSTVAMSENEICSFLVRAELALDQNFALTGLFTRVGFLRDGWVFFLDLFDREAVERTDGDEGLLYFEREIDIDYAQKHHVLIVAYLNSVYLFVDGTLQLYSDEMHIGRGHYALSMAGLGASTYCEVTNNWIWELDSAWDRDAGVCGVYADGDINKRSGPGTNFDRAGTLFADLVMAVDGQSVGSDGQVWWRLSDGSWVRSDLVEQDGDCSDAPAVN